MSHQYPHMSPLDLTVWRRFLLLHPSHFERIRYDVRVGSGSATWPEDAGQPPIEWLRLNQKRIDAVGVWKGGTAIIEVKPRASFSALGQLLAYRDLLGNKERPREPMTLWVVCADRDVDLDPTFLRYGVSVVAVGV